MLTRANAWLGYVVVLYLGLGIALSVGDFWRRDYEGAVQHYRETSAAQTREVARNLQGSLGSIYENIRTLSLLPSVQTINRHGENLSAESKLTFQQIYNNLAGAVAVSEVYILPVDLDPDRIDPVTGMTEAPILMFDELIVNARDKFLAAHPRADVATLPAYPEVEDFEYRQMKEQMAWLRQHYPTQASISGLGVPLISGPELITCDNTFYIHSLRDADRSGVVFIVPFYGTDGVLRGGVAAIILSRALHDLLPAGDYALVNTVTGFSTVGWGSGQEDASARWANQGRPDPGLIYSRVVPIETAAANGQWVLWAGHPDAAFFASPEVSQIRTTQFVSLAAVALLTLAGLVVWLLVQRNMQAAASTSAKLEERVAERTAEIQFLATHDDLTGLANRTQLISRLDEALDRAGDGLAVLALDIDHFKAVNDTFGHPAGDKLLREFSERLKNAAGEHDIIARFGGDEFMIVSLDVAGPYQAEHLARRIMEFMADPLELAGRSTHIGVSVGISISPADGGDPEQLIRNADIALYRAEADGRGTCRFFESGMDADLQQRHLLEADLHRALENGEFVLHYQPLINASDQTISGFEALVRWNHPERGLLAPSEFIPVAEETGVINPLGEWILYQACQDASGWPDDLKVAVNLSPAQFRQPALAHAVVAALDRAGLAPRRLELEITESALLLDNEHTLATLHQFRALGVQIAMDDFGTGFSSLSYLRSFPFDRIKIDRSFVSEVGDNPDCRAIVSAVAALGRSLGMHTTAEGIENPEQLRLALEQGCTDLQGFYFSKPMPANEVGPMLQIGTDRRGAVGKWSAATAG